MTEVIHKLNITPEAAFDISDCLGLEQFDKRTLKNEVGEYITRQSRAGCIPWWGYFRADYIDEDSSRRLKLFICKGDKFGLMQNWNLMGVCGADEWTREAEDDGSVRLWLESSITDLGTGDWVFEQIARAEADKLDVSFAVQGGLQELPRELKYAIEHGNNQELVEALRFFQNAGGKRAWRKYIERTIDVSRNLNQRDERGGLQTNERVVHRQALSRKGG